MMRRLVCLLLALGSAVLGEVNGGRQRGGPAAGNRPRAQAFNNGPSAGARRPGAGNAAGHKPTAPIKPQQQTRKPAPALPKPAGIMKRPQVAAGRRCPKSSCSSSSSSSHYVPPAQPKPCKDCNHITVIPDTGFYSFPYTGSNTWSPRTFRLCNKEPVRLTVLNCFCAGDYFEVFDNGVPILITDQSNSFPSWSSPCLNPTNDPAECLADMDFNRGYFDLPAGSHNLTILVGASWWTGGAGFLRVDTLCTFDSVTQPCCAATQSCPNFIVA